MYLVVRTLLSHGASCNEQDNIGNTPLHLGIVLYAIYSMWYIFTACVAGHIDTVTLLLKAGEIVGAKNENETTDVYRH